MSTARSNTLRSAAVFAAGLMLVGCGTTPAPGAGADQPVVAAVQPRVACSAGDLVKAPDAPVAAVVDGIAQFGHDLHAAAAVPGRNFVLSPYSVATAFAMARAGAAGGTADQIDAVMHFPATGLHDAMGEIDRRLTGDRVLQTANGLFVQDGLPLVDSYCAQLARSYGVSPLTVDFVGPAAKATIDAWVRDRTDDQIEELFAELPPTTKLVLANALSLDALWAVPFAKFPVTSAPFTTADGSVVSADRMQVVDELKMASVAGSQVVEVPYEDSGLAMRLVLPAPGVLPIDTLEPDFMASTHAALADADRSKIVDLALPKWTTTTELDLVDLLTGLGMIMPFGRGADFSSMTRPSLFIDQAITKVTITVNEYGTKAAAVTGLAFEESGPPVPEITIQLDRPFAYAIVDVATGLPVFLGQVNDPTAG